MRRRRGLHWVVALALVIGAVVEVVPQSSTPEDDDTPTPVEPTNTPVSAALERGEKKFGDRCNSTSECGFDGGVCDGVKKTCQCVPELPATNHIDKCGKEAAVNESCFFTEQCETTLLSTECRDGHCVCRFELTPEYKKDGSIECVGPPPPVIPKYLDPAMIGVLVGMALMFVIICVVLRLFSKARWRENRTIFNTPNPRLMNVSLLRDSKLLHGNEQRRGSRASVRAPSRQPSMASLRPHSPSGSPGSRRGSKGSLHSPTSAKSQTAPGHPNHHDHHAAHHEHGHHEPIHHEPPILESVTVEVQETKVV